jgi:hypothetical protein
MADPAPLLLNGTDVPIFSFSGGTLTISYRGTAYITILANTWHKWYTYTYNGSLYFQDKLVAGPAAYSKPLYNNDKLRSSLAIDPKSAPMYLIGNGDIRPTGTLGFSVPLDNVMAPADSPTNYAVIKVNSTVFYLTSPSPLLMKLLNGAKKAVSKKAPSKKAAPKKAAAKKTARRK